jgi:hypothetical protein
MALTQSEKQQLQARLEKRKVILLDELQTGVQRLRTESAGDGGIPEFHERRLDTIRPRTL